MSDRRRAVRTVSFALLGALALASVPAPVALAGSGSMACRVHNVTQDEDGRSFGRMVARAQDGDRLRVQGSCTSNGVVIDKDLSIRGLGAGATVRARFRDFEHARRVLRVAEGAHVALRDLTVQRGWLDCVPPACRLARGAGILNEGHLVLRGVVVEMNGGLLVSGLAIWNGGTLVLRRSVVRYNGEQDGSDAAIVNHGTLVLRKSRVRDNDRAGIINYGVARLVDSVVARHRLGDGSRGITNHGTLTVVRSVIRANSAYSGESGGIQNDGALVVIDSLIRNNRTVDYGAGIWNSSDATAVVRGSRISGNVADYRGGGIGNQGTLTLVDSVVRGNRAFDAGGGIYNGGLDGEPVGTVAIDSGSSVSGNVPDDCVGTTAC